HAFDLSDDDVVWGWVENPYWQVFTGETYLQIEPPIDPSSLTRWRQRLGDEGIEELLAVTISAGQRSGAVRKSSLKTVIVDTTVMPKAVAHPTDSRLLERSREHLVKAAGECGLKLRQNYNREAPKLALQIGRYAHARQFKRMNKGRSDQSASRPKFPTGCRLISENQKKTSKIPIFRRVFAQKSPFPGPWCPMGAPLPSNVVAPSTDCST